MNKKVSGMERDFLLDRFIKEAVRLVSESNPSCVIVPVFRDANHLAYIEHGLPLTSKDFFCATIGTREAFRLELEPTISNDGRKLVRLPAYISYLEAKLQRKASATLFLRLATAGGQLEFSADKILRGGGHSLILSPSRDFSFSDNTALNRLSGLLQKHHISIRQDLDLPTLGKICARGSQVLFLDFGLGIPEQDPSIGSIMLTRSQFEETVKRMDNGEQARIKQELKLLASLNASVIVYPCSLQDKISTSTLVFTLEESKFDADKVLDTLGFLEAMLALSAAINQEGRETNRILAVFSHGLVLSVKEKIPETPTVFYLSLGKRTLRGSALPEWAGADTTHYYYYRFMHMEPEDLRYLTDYLCGLPLAESAVESREFARLCGL